MMIRPGLKCPDCGQEVSPATQAEFVGRPDDFAHSSWACVPRMREIMRLQTRALLAAEFAIDDHAPYVEKLVEEALTAAGLPTETSRDEARRKNR